MTSDNGYETAEDIRAPSPEPPASANDTAPTSDEDATTDVVILGAFGDKPLEVQAEVVLPADYFIAIDGASCDGEYVAAQHFSTWYGEDGAENHVRADSITRSFQCRPGEVTPWDRVNEMAQSLQRQSASVTSPTGSLWERRDPWGRREPASLVREMGDSAETVYHNDMYVTSKMASRWKEIHWWRIDKRCWEATYGPNTEAWAYLCESKGVDGKP
jgi:hypothetical protein